MTNHLTAYMNGENKTVAKQMQRIRQLIAFQLYCATNNLVPRSNEDYERFESGAIKAFHTQPNFQNHCDALANGIYNVLIHPER